MIVILMDKECKGHPEVFVSLYSCTDAWIAHKPIETTQAESETSLGQTLF